MDVHLLKLVAAADVIAEIEASLVFHCDEIYNNDILNNIICNIIYYYGVLVNPHVIHF